jgi:uncharacterized iron-regulated membrane protein
MATRLPESVETDVAPTTGLYRLFWRWHFFAAVLVVPFVLWQSVTGSLYLWSYAWMDASEPQLRFVVPNGPTAPLSAQLTAAFAAESGASLVEIRLPDAADRSTLLLLQENSGLVRPVFIDPYGPRVLGSTDAWSWLPGLTRNLHGGWPLGKAGSWLLELGACWAMVMIVSGLYLWWPRRLGWLRALWPRTNAGARVFWRDLHACVAAWFTLLILCFLLTAMPWTAFWGGQILGPIQRGLDQQNPAGFSPGGAALGSAVLAGRALDRIVADARQDGVVGTLQIRLGAAPNSEWWVHNTDSPPGQDRYLVADRYSGAIKASIHGSENPVMARLIDAGVHLHQGDYGWFNRWGNTAVAAALIWIAVTGATSWWKRRPQGSVGVPPKSNVPWPRALVVGAVSACAIFPLLGVSVAALWLFDALGTRVVRTAV